MNNTNFIIEPHVCNDHDYIQNVIIPNETQIMQQSDQGDMDEEVTWDNTNINLLLTEYLARKDRFRNSKIKKIVLWREIAAEFGKMNKKITPSELNKKFINMKTTYSKIKKNNSKRTTGSGRKPWAWLADMDEIFHNDLSINFTSNVVSSMSADENQEPINLATSSTSMSADENQDPINLATSSTSSDNNISDILSDSNSRASSSNSRNLTNDTNEVTSPNFYKSARGKTMYYYRKKQLDLDADKLEIMRTFNKKFEEQKNLQKETLSTWNEKINDWHRFSRKETSCSKKSRKY